MTMTSVALTQSFGTMRQTGVDHSTQVPHQVPQQSWGLPPPLELGRGLWGRSQKMSASQEGAPQARHVHTSLIHDLHMSHCPCNGAPAYTCVHAPVDARVCLYIRALECACVHLEIGYQYQYLVYCSSDSIQHLLLRGKVSHWIRTQHPA